MQQHAISLFLKTVRSPLKFKLFLWFKLPLAAIAGLKIITVTEEQATIQTRCSWITQNPFKSTFWAVMGMGAEMSSGLLVMMYNGPKGSMYVTRCKADFNKRAVGKTFYTCSEGEMIRSAVEACRINQSSTTIDCTTIVTNEEGDKIAEFIFTWSVKPR